MGNFLAVQWLGLCASTAGGHRFDPWSGTNIPQAAWPKKKKKKKGIVMPPNLFFFLKIALTIQSLLWIHINFRIFFYFCGKCQWNFDRDCIDSVDHFG